MHHIAHIIDNEIYIVFKDYNTYDIIADAARTKNVCSVGVSPSSTAPTVLNPPGSLSGLPGGWRRRNQVPKCARSLLTSPGSAEARSGNAGGVFAFFHWFPVAQRELWWSLFIPGSVVLLGCLKGDGVHVAA
jgi:hypothetical protein